MPLPKTILPSGTLSISLNGGTAVLAEILAGGQSFLWEPLSENQWGGVIGAVPFRVQLRDDHRLTWECLDPNEVDPGERVEEYFACATDYESITDSLPWRSDPVLRQAVNSFPGLRILRQDPETTLLSFLLSPLKRIEQIRAGLLKIAHRWGPPLGDGLSAPPSWNALAQVSEPELRTCGIGYRARSIRQTAVFLESQPDFLRKIQPLSTEEARDRLMVLPGVGRKIADCVLLFGYGRLESFPIDTWISRHMKTSYGLEGYSDSQIQQFARAHYGAHAGVAQQFLFAQARKG